MTQPVQQLKTVSITNYGIDMKTFVKYLITESYRPQVNV